MKSRCPYTWTQRAQGRSESLAPGLLGDRDSFELGVGQHRRQGVLVVAGVPDGRHHGAGRERELRAHRLAVLPLGDPGKSQRQSGLLRPPLGGGARRRLEQGPVLALGERVGRPCSAAAGRHGLRVGLLEVGCGRREEVAEPVAVLGAGQADAGGAGPGQAVEGPPPGRPHRGL